jgi:hypothetical protein
MSEDRQAAHGDQESPPTQAEDATSPGRQPAGARSPDRRRFLLGAGGLTAAALIGAGGGWSPRGRAALAAPASPSSSTQANGSSSWLDRRRARALKLRIDTAKRQLAGAFPQRQTNGDEDAYPAGLANFTKTLPHNRRGEVDPVAYRTLLRALDSGKPADFDKVPLAGTTKLANPQAAFAFELEGADPWGLTVEPPPRLASETFAGEMTECYHLALARDVPYTRYGQEPVAAAAVEDLRRFDDYRDVEARTLFRSDFPGVTAGPYISQFLLQPYTFGGTPIQQRYRTTMPASDHLTSYAGWLDAQNGRPATSAAWFDPLPRYIRNGRDLGEWSHRDFSYQGPLVACLILLDYLAQHGPEVLDEANPYQGSATQSGVVTFGAPHVLDLVARVANHAMKAAWYHKWLVHRRFRPEEAAGRIHNHMTGAADYPLHPKLTDSAALDSLYSRHGSYLCPQAYPEGCPAHPAYPGATATIGGAGVSVLKAFFNEAWVIPNPVVPSDDGLSLRPWKGEPLTVGGELNKLAFNMAFGRDTAGVHFREDEVEGIVLGELSAFSVMADVNTTYNEGFDGFQLTSFDGTTTTI